jgi:hypothetical protein
MIQSPSFSLVLKHHSPTRQPATPPNFYIQSKGLHSGRPMRTPIPNCIGVYTALPYAYEAATAAYLAKAYQPIIAGTCIPFVYIKEAREVLARYIDRAAVAQPKQLQLLTKATAYIDHLERSLAKAKELRFSIAHNL